MFVRDLTHFSRERAPERVNDADERAEGERAGEDAPSVSARKTAATAFTSVEVLREREAGATGWFPV